jgi:hypothetical protein
MLTIDRLRLLLPPGFETRADRIARLVADEVAARLPLRGETRLDRLTLPRVQVPRGASDRQVAQSVARALVAGLNRPSPSGGGGP